MRTWQDNAAEFAALDRGEGWQFAVLVACSAERLDHGGKMRSHLSGKVSAKEFAEAAGTAGSRVIRYLDAWQEAAARGWVPDAETLTPADVRTVEIPDKPWRAKDKTEDGERGVYDASRTGGQINNTGQIADKAAKDPQYAERVMREVAQAAPEVAATALTESIGNSTEAATQAMKALDDRYEASPKPIAPHETSGAKPVELVHQFRQLHRSVDSIIALVIEGKAVVSDAERDAVLREVQWLRTALGYIEDGVQSNSLDSALEDLLRAES